MKAELRQETDQDDKEEYVQPTETIQRQIGVRGISAMLAVKSIG